MRGLAVFAIVAVGVAFVGCAKPLEVASITEIKPPPGASGIDVYAERRRTGEKVPEFAGDQIVEIRTFAQPQDGGIGEEFAGALCKVSARDFSADARSPAKVRVPIYRAQSSQLAVSCEKEGYRPRMIELAAFNATKAERMSAASGGGVVGVLLVTAVNAASDETTHDFRYPPARLVLEPITSSPPARTAAAQ